MYQPKNNSTSSNAVPITETNSQQQQKATQQLFTINTSYNDAMNMYGQQQQRNNQQIFAPQQQQQMPHFQQHLYFGQVQQNQQKQTGKRTMPMESGGGRNEEKENCGPTATKRPCYLESTHQEKQLATMGQPKVREVEEADDEEQQEDEEEEEEEQDTSDSLKTESESSEETIQPSGGAQTAMLVGQSQLYTTPKQQQQHWNFGAMIPFNPLTHSTPLATMPAYSGSNALLNLQALTNYTCNNAAPFYSPINAFGPFIAGNNGGGSSASQQLQQQQAQNQQQMLNAYGGFDPTSGVAATAQFLARSQQQLAAAVLYPSPKAATSVHVGRVLSSQSSLDQNNSIGSSLGHDSGLGIGANGHKNESSSGGSSEESGASILIKREQAPPEPRFPPYLRHILLDGQKQLRDLEELPFAQVPARLPLLNSMKKYTVTVAEIHRRVGAPECLNTSYLGGILRRAKNEKAGPRLREELANLGGGMELQTGKRKSSQVTTLTTLCEREAIQLATDFGKVVNDPQNGFPYHQLAMELNRRALHSSPEQQKQRLEGVKNSMEILFEAIGIVEQAIEQETLQLATPNELLVATAPPVDDDGKPQLLPQTLNQFKRFARLSHCFGNRSMLTCWQSLFHVFSQYETIMTHGIMGASGGGGVGGGQFGSQLLPGTSAAAGYQHQITAEQASANALLEKIYKQERGQ